MATQEVRPIIVGVDGSSSSLAALDWAARQGALTHEPLLVILTWEWPRNLGWAAPVPDGYDPESDARHVVDEAVEAVRAAHPDVEIRGSATQARPAPALVEASRGSSLLVVGSRGHGGFSGMLLGSVSQHCVTNAHCPVVVIRDLD
jgi:nucleotide-binding universal stress UspA family protein